MEAAMPFAAMIMVECTDVIISTLGKAAMAKGMSTFVYVVYSNALATLLLLPFVLASCRMEKLDLKRSSGKAKCVGTILAVSGASFITLFKGPVLILSSPSSNEFVKQQLISQKSSWIFGGFLFLITCFLSATWTISQAWFVHKYPTKKMTNVFFFTLFVTLQTAAFSVVVETNPMAWQLRPDIEMFAIVFAAIFGSVVRIGVHTWCLQRRGPVYVAMFKPLGMVIALVLVVTFLHESLYLGSVMGSIMIACGFYTVIWAQIKELDINLAASSDSQSASLLHHSSSIQHT